MNNLGNKIAKKRKDLGMTQTEFADKLSVTRQTVSRWEAGAVMPDIDKISDIADILDVSCDYLLKDDAADEKTAALKGPSRLLAALVGTKVKLKFFDEETDVDLYDEVCTVLELEGNCDLRGVGKRSCGFGEIVRGCFDFDSLCRDIAEFSICGIAEI